MATTIRVDGLRELQRAFRVAGDALSRDLRAGLKDAAEPLRSEAENLTFSRISGMRRGKIPWHSMRVGVTRTMVYVAPVQRGDKSRAGLRRRNLAPRIVREAFEPAVAAHERGVVRRVEDELDDMEHLWERA